MLVKKEDLGKLAFQDSTPYEIMFFFPGKPGNNAIVYQAKIARRTVLPVSLTGSTGCVGTNPTATTTLTLKQNGTSIGSASISTAGVFSFTFSAQIILSAGDVLSVTNQASSDATCADISLSLVCMV